MSYTFNKTLQMGFDDAVATVTAALAGRGFGVLTTIDVRATLKKKIGADFRPYTILGACNPNMAYQALQAEPHIGAMLPCNVLVQQLGDAVEVAAVDPVASMSAIDNERLGVVANEVRAQLREVIESL